MCDTRDQVLYDNTNRGATDGGPDDLEREQFEPSGVVPSETAMLREPTSEYHVDQVAASDPILEDIIHTYMGAWKILAS